MELEFMDCQVEAPIDRVYIASAMLANFRGRQHVEAHLFRPGATAEEIESLKGKCLVGEADPAMPAEVLAGATEEAALGCIAESFTKEEAHLLAEYLQNRYADQIEKLTICPISLPVPLGVGPLAKIPEGHASGFINFDQARDYKLPFALKGYYDLEQLANE